MGALRSGVASCIGLVISAMIVVGPVCGQAWVGAKGSGSVGMDFQFTESEGLLVDHERFTVLDDVGNEGFTASLNLEWVPLENWGLVVHAPFTVNELVAPPGFADSVLGRAVLLGRQPGDEVSTFQDLSIEARRGYTAGKWAIAPFLGVSTPLQNYEVQTFRLAGRGLSELKLGANFGHRWGTEERGFLHLRHMFSIFDTFGERVNNLLEDVKLTMHNTNLDVGYQVSPKMTVSANAHLRNTSGGIECEEALLLGGILLGGGALSARDAARLNFHFPLRNEYFILLGAEVEYQLDKDWSAYAGYKDMVRGDNTQPAHVFSTGATWAFD